MNTWDALIPDLAGPGSVQATGRVTDDGVRLRAGPDTTTGILAVLSTGDLVYVYRVMPRPAGFLRGLREARARGDLPEAWLECQPVGRALTGYVYSGYVDLEELHYALR